MNTSARVGRGTPPPSIAPTTRTTTSMLSPMCRAHPSIDRIRWPSAQFRSANTSLRSVAVRCPAPGFAGRHGTGVTVVVWADGWPPPPLCVKVVGLVVVVSHHALSDAQKTRIASVLCACGLPVLINSTLKNHLSERNEISSLYGFEHAHTHARTRTYIRIFAYI